MRSVVLRSVLAASFSKSGRSSTHDTAKPISTAQNGAPIENTGTLATVIRNATDAPNVNAPLNDVTKARSSTFRKARPASVATNTFGSASATCVNAGENIPNRIARIDVRMPAA